MGGAAAKIRRRLERQPLQPAAAAPAAETSSGLVKKKVAPQGRSGRNSGGGNSGSKSAPLTKGNHRGGRSASTTSKPKPVKKATEKKFKKPKHLKRKLESLPETDQAEKEQLLQKLQDLERVKKLKGNSATTKTPQKEHTTTDHTRKKPTRDAEQPRQEKHEVPSRRDSAVTKEKSRKVERAASASAPEKRVDAETTPKKGSKVEVAEESAAKDAEQMTKPKPSEKRKIDNLASGDNNNNSDDSDDSGDDNDDDANLKRQRGKRRRGRKDTSNTAAGEAAQNDSMKTAEASGEAKLGESDDTDVKKKKQEGERRCIGRKPVTDYQVGQSYPAKVVYAKPFGVFLDIGCHADAFCHVSRLSDDFVESPEALFPPGLVVQAARVVEVDRRRKRITVSLQTSEARMRDEMASIEARKGRRQKHGRADKPVPSNEKASSDWSPKLHSERSNAPHEETRHADTTKANCSSQEEDNVATTPESEMTPAELKRSRKQARRAGRRAAREHVEEKQ